MKFESGADEDRNPAEQELGRAACWVDDNYAGAVELTGTAEVGSSTPTWAACICSLVARG